MRQLTSPLPIHRVTGGIARVSAPPDYAGPLLQGPNFPLDAGEWHASFALRSEGAHGDTNSPVAWVGVASDSGSVQHARREVLADDLDATGAWMSIGLDFSLSEMTMGLDVQGFTYGQAAIGAQMVVGLHRLEDVAFTHGRAVRGTSANIPEPRTVEIAAMLGRRAVRKAKAKARATVGSRSDSPRR